ncbi:Uncharacterized protein APZ42_002867, partial [Daphnia magna]
VLLYNESVTFSHSIVSKSQRLGQNISGLSPLVELFIFKISVFFSLISRALNVLLTFCTFVFNIVTSS